MSKKLGNIIESANKMYNLTGTLRFNNQFLLKYENVAEHSYMVVSIVNLICNHFKIDKDTHLEALQYAIVHDVPESITGDIISPTKNAIKGFAEDLDNYEKDLMYKHFPNLYVSFVNFQRAENRVAHHILKIADYMAVNVCMNREQSLGNKYPFVQEIIDVTNSKINLHYELLADLL